MRGALQPSVLREAADLSERGVPCALATVVTATGSVPGKVGATMLVTVDGTSKGTVGGAGLEERVKALCREAIQRGSGGVHSFDLANWKPRGLDSVCGGTVTISIHVVQATPHLLLIGGGHCSLALARIADVLDWSHSVVDSRPGYADAERFPHARALATEAPADFLAHVEDLSRFSHVYIMGHSHAEDGEALVALLSRDYAGTLGVIGSRAKMRAFQTRAAEKGIPASAFDRVRSPIGVDVGAQTPAEIAVAVAAEIIADVRRAGTQLGAPVGSSHPAPRGPLSAERNP
jgi:xanthine dehydrogenase accessory factor